MNMLGILIAGLLIGPALESTASEKPDFTLERVGNSSNGTRKTMVKLTPEGDIYVSYSGCVTNRCKKFAAHIAHKKKGETKWEAKIVDRREKKVGWFGTIHVEPDGGVRYLHTDQNAMKLRESYQAPGRSTWTSRELDTDFYGGWWASSAMNKKGDIFWTHMGSPEHREFMNTQMTVSTYSGSTWTHEILDTTLQAGHFTSVTTTPDGRPVVGYVNGFFRGTLIVAEKQMDGSWKSFPVSNGAAKSSLGVDSKGFIHVAYAVDDPSVERMADDLWYATNAPDGKWRSVILDEGEPDEAYAGEHPHLLIDRDDDIHVFYRESWGRSVLRYARLEATAAEDNWEFFTVDGAGGAGLYVWAELDKEGGLHFAHEDGRSIYYSYCGNCTRQIRKR